MNIFIYFSTYIIIAGFLYYFNFINYNPFSWLIIALSASIFISLYVIKYNYYYNPNFNYLSLIKYIVFNSPKLLLLFIIDHKNIFNGFIFYSSLCIIYLILIDFNVFDIYYNKTILKVINNDFSASVFS
jgi:hypothetical protein